MNLDAGTRPILEFRSRMVGNGTGEGSENLASINRMIRIKTKENFFEFILPILPHRCQKTAFEFLEPISLLAHQPNSRTSC